MTIPDQLNTFRRALPGVSVVALGDMAAGLVLCASHDGNMPQERLDRLCQSAAALLAGPNEFTPETASEMAVIASGLRTEVFVRSPIDADDVLCCVCEPDVDISGVARLARQTLSDMAGEG